MRYLEGKLCSSRLVYACSAWRMSPNSPRPFAMLVNRSLATTANMHIYGFPRVVLSEVPMIDSCHTEVPWHCHACGYGSPHGGYWNTLRVLVVLVLSYACRLPDDSADRLLHPLSPFGWSRVDSAGALAGHDQRLIRMPLALALG